MREVERLFDLSPRGFEAGIERELVFMAREGNGEVYNFNISPQVYAHLHSPELKDDGLRAIFQQGWIVEQEYSKALIEIISPPKRRGQLPELTAGALYIRRRINRLVSQIVEDRYPHLYDFRFFTQSRGTSPTDKYLTPEGSIISDQESFLDNILEETVDFVRHFTGFEMEIAGHTETNIGIYNHLNSTHITFHPEYTKDQDVNRDKYFRQLMRLNNIVLLFRAIDQGNRQILREGKVYEADKNIRDLFLIALYRYLYDGHIDTEYIAQSASVEAEVDNLENYHERIKELPEAKGASDIGIDETFRSWDSLNLRPRFINDKLPVIEIRAFGSSIGLARVQQLIQSLAILDRNY